MSGGRYEYRQYGFTDVIDDLKSIIEKNGQTKTIEEMKAEFYHYDADWYEKYPEEKLYYNYPENVIEEFKKAVDIISRAQVYMHRIDWLLSGDDGDESFIKRLDEDLSKL